MTIHAEYPTPKGVGVAPAADWVEAHGGIDELDKRLMPSDIEWPRFDDGERVEFGSAVDGLGGPCEKFIFTRSMGGVCQLQDAGGRMVNVLHGGRVKRPKPEVLAADGLPINVGDTLYGAGREQSVYTVASLRAGEGWFSVECEDRDGYRFMVDASMFSHTKPDTQERIDKDAIMDAGKYVAGRPEAALLREPPGSLSAKQAMMADLLRRQRELDARTMGGEK